jgi:hypothetical protein
MNQVTPFFKKLINPNKKRKEKSADKRAGMDPKHIENVNKLPSCISGLKPCDAHHLRIHNERGVGLRATDRWCVPLTRQEHMEVHRVGSKKEEEWFLARGIACYELANALWNAKGDLDAMRLIVMTHLEDRPKRKRNE